MLTLDDAICYCEYMADYDTYNDVQYEYAEKHRQIAELLRKLSHGGKAEMEVVNKIKVKLDDGAFIPERAHEDDAGLDLKYPDENVTVRVGQSVVIDTGIHVQIPRGYVGMLKSKSGLNVKYGLQNEGVIDAGYTGSIVVKLYNNGQRDILVEHGDKIAQLVILPIITPEIELVDELEETERGNAGFGSTGR